MYWTAFGWPLWLMPLGFCALVQVMDQVDPTLWQRLLGDVFIIVAQGLAYKSQKRTWWVLHGTFQDVQATFW
jgi:hypothetical protein